MDLIKEERKRKILLRARKGENFIEQAILNNDIKSIKQEDNNLPDIKQENDVIKKKNYSKIINKIRIILIMLFGILCSFLLKYNIKHNIFCLFLFLSSSFNYFYYRKKNIKIDYNNKNKSNIILKLYENYNKYYFVIQIFDDISCFIIPFLISSSLLH